LLLWSWTSSIWHQRQSLWMLRCWYKCQEGSCIVFNFYGVSCRTVVKGLLSMLRWCWCECQEGACIIFILYEVCGSKQVVHGSVSMLGRSCKCHEGRGGAGHK
jgi:hypothetical protein